MSDTDMSLGRVIRATRMGYHWTGTCWMRISDARDPGGGCWRVDIRPGGLIPKNDKLKGKHRVWWDDFQWFIEHCAFARVKPKRAFTIHVNDDGAVL